MAVIDLRPPGTSVAAWPGQARGLTTTGFPTGYLTGKTHEWRLARAGQSATYATLAATIDGDTLVSTLEVPRLTGDWFVTLFETTGDLEEPRAGFTLDVDRSYSSEQTDITVPLAVNTGPIGITLDVTLSAGGGGQVDEVVAGPGISVDDTDPAAPVITADVTQAELDAVTAAIATAITNLINGAPAGGDTLGELDARLAVIEALGSLATDAELIAAVAAILGTADSDGDTLGELQALIGLRLLKSQNLADLPNVVTARANLSVYSIAAVDALLGTYVALAGATMSGALEVPADPYDETTWDDSDEVPTKGDLRDILEALAAGKQDADGDLTDFSALSPANDDFLQRKAGAWTNRTPAEALADLKPSRVVAEDHTANTAVNSSAEETVATATLPGGSVAVGDRVILRVWGSMKNSSGAGVNYTVGLKVGSTSLVPAAASSLASSANRRPFAATIECIFPTLTSESWFGQFQIGNAAASGQTVGATTSAGSAGVQTAAEDSANPLTFAVTVTMGTASPNAEVVVDAVSLEIVRKS